MTDLSDAQKAILKDKETEPPFTGALLHNGDQGNYVCADCGSELFSSGTKFESGSGWPSFYDVIKTTAVKLIEDDSHGMRRVEVSCAQCGGHLGHVFPDGPADKTGQRFCINSCAINFMPEDKAKPMVRGDSAHSQA